MVVGKEQLTCQRGEVKGALNVMIMRWRNFDVYGRHYGKLHDHSKKNNLPIIGSTTGFLSLRHIRWLARHRGADKFALYANSGGFKKSATDVKEVVTNGRFCILASIWNTVIGAPSI